MISLRGDKDALHEVKEKLCVLWGNLEENKTALRKQKSIAARQPEPQSSEPQSFQRPGEQPSLDSDDENSNSGPTRYTRSSTRLVLKQLDSHNSNELGTAEPIAAVSNKPFTCCIKQYGAKVHEDDPTKATAGDGKKWKRMFGLFGTQIS